MDVLLVSIGGAIGAVARYAVGQLVATRPFPWATLVVNLVGCLILGGVIAGVSSSEVLLLVGVGFCGAFTTFSSFSYQTVDLWEREAYAAAVANAAGTLLVSLTGFAIGWVVGTLTVA